MSDVVNTVNGKRHVHDCTGPDMRCGCGFVFPKPARFCVSVEIFDNETKQTVYAEGFNCEYRLSAINSLERAIAAMRSQAMSERPRASRADVVSGHAGQSLATKEVVATPEGE